MSVLYFIADTCCLCHWKSPSSLPLPVLQAVVYSGRQLDVSLALSPRELEDMAERGREKTDKRNLYLAKEGSKRHRVQTPLHKCRGLGC